MANAGNHEQGSVTMSAMEEGDTQIGTSAIGHLYAAGIYVGRKQGVLQSSEDIQN